MSAESNEGVEEHGVGDASFLCPFSCRWGHQLAMLVYIVDLKNSSRHSKPVKPAHQKALEKSLRIKDQSFPML